MQLVLVRHGEPEWVKDGLNVGSYLRDTLADMRAMVARMPRAELHEISSHFGHDAFLKEAAVLRPFLQEL